MPCHELMPLFSNTYKLTDVAVFLNGFDDYVVGLVDPDHEVPVLRVEHPPTYRPQTRIYNVVIIQSALIDCITSN